MHLENQFFGARANIVPKTLFLSFNGDSYEKQLFSLTASWVVFWPYFANLSVAQCLQTPSLHSCLQCTEEFTVLSTIKSSSCIGRCFVPP